MKSSNSLPAERRERSGKGPARALRRAGKVPGIIYGGNAEPERIALPLKELKLAIGTNARFFSTVFELDFGDGKARVLPREAQLHPLSDEPLHVDFFRAEVGAVVTVDVPVEFTKQDQSPGIKRGGALNIVRREVELLCPADAIPSRLVVDLSGTEIGDSIHISQINLPEGVKPTITDRDFTICSIVPPTTATEEAPAAAAAGTPATPAS
ncbi:MAG: 50S ribosomal protein L25/general stress protein Ctc [Geminicoccaceae bacterium]